VDVCCHKKKKAVSLKVNKNYINYPIEVEKNRYSAVKIPILVGNVPVIAKKKLEHKSGRFGKQKPIKGQP